MLNLTPEQLQEIEQMQVMIDQYHGLRSQTNLFINNLPTEKQQLALEQVKRFRNPETETQALSSLRDILATLYGREATTEELRQGLRINSGMSGIGGTASAAVGATILFGGLVALSGLYSSLFGAEGALQQALGIAPTQREPGETPGSILKEKAKNFGKWAAIMAATGYGGYYLFDRLANR